MCEVKGSDWSRLKALRMVHWRSRVKEVIGEGEQKAGVGENSRDMVYKSYAGKGRVDKSGGIPT